MRSTLTYSTLTRYGHPLRHVVYSSLTETVVLAAVAPGAAMLLALLVAHDDDVWKSVRLCEQHSVCTDVGLLSQCSDFDRSMNFVFVFNAMASVAMVTKAISIVAFVYVQRGHNMSLSSALDLTTDERLQDGFFVWTSCGVCDLASLVFVCYRHGIFMLETHSQQLYPKTADETGVTLLFVSWLCVAVGCTCTAFALYRLILAWFELRQPVDSVDNSEEGVSLLSQK
jgi:hypothetical protein